MMKKDAIAKKQHQCADLLYKLRFIISLTENEQTFTCTSRAGLYRSCKKKKRKKEKQTTKNYSRQMVGLPAWPKCLGWSDLWGLSAGQAGRSEGRPAKSAKPPAWSSLFFFHANCMADEILI